MLILASEQPPKGSFPPQFTQLQFGTERGDTTAGMRHFSIEPGVIAEDGWQLASHTAARGLPFGKPKRCTLPKRGDVFRLGCPALWESSARAAIEIAQQGAHWGPALPKLGLSKEIHAT